MEKLKKISNYQGPKGPVLLVIMDGVGIGKYKEGDMVQKATTPTLDWLRENAVSAELQAHGLAVGLPSDDDMGNSEVGHNAMGCGRVFAQGASLVNKSIETRALFEGDVWQQLVENCLDQQSTLHFIGLLSDGNVHSNIAHLEAMLAETKARGVEKARIHVLLDGRDVPPTSALEYINRLENTLSELNTDGSIDYCIASGGGRMKVTMDRYEADWEMIDLGWKTHVKGEGSFFASAQEAVEQLRKDHPGILDQDLPPFVIAREEKAVGPIVDHDSVIFFNFRGDRSIEISKAFEDDKLSAFDRGPRLNIQYAGMMQYDGDLHIPKHYLVNPPEIDRTMGELLTKEGVKQLAISETQKYGHVTYFFNGNRSGKFDESLEDYIEIPSDRLPFEERPWMKAAEITDEVIEAIEHGSYQHIRLNFANGDMVGHTGVQEAAEVAVETVDLCLSRLRAAIDKTSGIMVVSADHGNADDMLEHDKKTGDVKIDATTGQPVSRTAHSLNPVPVFVYDPAGTANVRLSSAENLGISSIAATILMLLGFDPPPDYTPSIIEVA